MGVAHHVTLMNVSHNVDWIQKMQDSATIVTSMTIWGLVILNAIGAWTLRSLTLASFLGSISTYPYHTTHI